MSHAICPSFKIMFGNLQHVPQRELGALGGVERERSSPGPGSSWGKKEKNWRGRKKIGERSEPRGSLGRGKGGGTFLPPGPTTAEPGPMRREGRIHFLSETFFFLHGTKEATTAVFGKNIPIPGLAVDCG